MLGHKKEGQYQRSHLKWNEIEKPRIDFYTQFSFYFFYIPLPEFNVMEFTPVEELIWADFMHQGFRHLSV